jgi:hypothetical protein
MRSLRRQVWSRPVLFVANPSLFQKVRRSLQSAPGKRRQLAALASNHPGPHARETREGAVTSQISRRGKEYLETAKTLLRSAQTMTDRAIAVQLKALADDYERRAEKASRVDAARELARSAEIERAPQFEAD